MTAIAERPSPIRIDRPLALSQERATFRLEEFAARQREIAFLEKLLPSFGPNPFGIMGAAAGAWTFTNGGRTSLQNGTFDIDTDSFKMALFLSTSNIGAASTTYAGVTNEHANANGYTTGGIAQTLTLAGTTTVTTAASASPTWTASGGSIVARFAVIYEVAGNVLCYCLLDATPADVTVTTGNQFTVATTTSIYTLS